MLAIDADIKIYIHRDHIDLRKSIDGIVVLVVNSMQLEPQSQSLFLFHNKARDKVKAILWHHDGFILLYKRKEKGKFKFPKNVDELYYCINNDLLQWLLKEFDFYLLQCRWRFKSGSNCPILLKKNLYNQLKE